VLGLPVDASHTADTTINLLDTANIPLKSLDLSLAHVSLLGGIVDLNGAIAQQVLAALPAAVSSLPDLSIPAALAQVKLTPNVQTPVDGGLIQRALRIQISLAGQSIADLGIGQAAVTGTGDCTPAKPEQPQSAPQAALECTARKLTLIDVLRDGDHVRLFGAADKSLAGKTVSIVFQATHATVAHATVNPDGSFTTSAPLPTKSIRNTNSARYVAKSGDEQSLNLKLKRRMIVRSIESHSDYVRIRGHVVRPLATPAKAITVKRRVTCHSFEVVKTFRPNRDGSFDVKVPKPKGDATVYRLQTMVRSSPGSSHLFPTFTLPRAVDL
jgi:hypothetical protein